MRVAVTGATGNLGTAVVRALLRRPEITSVVGITRRPPGWEVDRVRWVAADLARDDLQAPLETCDAVVHLAWAIQPGRLPDVLWRTNVVGTDRLLAAVAKVGVAGVVHASSVGAYAPGPRIGRVDESWPTHGIPQLDYSWQKAYAERMLDAHEALHPHRRVARIRPALVFRHDVAHEIARLFLGGLVPHRLLGPGLARLVEHLPVPFQVVHSDDVAEAFVEAVLVGAQGAFNVAAEPPLGSGPAPGWLEPVGHGLAAAAWRLHAIETNPGWVDLALRAPLMDTTRARTELGWRPRHDAHETLRELLAGFRDDATFATPPLAE